MDGSSRGGIAISIIKKLNIPIYFIGTGEDWNDLIPFKRNDYIKSLISNNNEYINE